MKRAFDSEWTRITRPGYLLGFGGVIVGLTSLFAALILWFVASAPAVEPGGLPPRAVFEDASGAVAPLVITLGLMSAAALVLGSLSVASEYGHGTLRVMLVAHPRRWSYLAGKTGAIWTLVAAFVVAAVLLQVVIAAIIMQGRGADVSAWWTAQAFQTNGATIARAIGVTWVWVLIGVMLATLLRNAAAAIGIGFGYNILVEPILGVVVDHAGPFLPAAVLSTFAAGGNAVLSSEQAGGLLLLYAVAFAAVSLFVFERRDVSV